MTASNQAMLSILLFIPVVLLALVVKNPYVLFLGFLPFIYVYKKFSEHSRLKSEYTNSFKQKVIGGMLRLFSDDLNIVPQSSITEREYREADLFRERLDTFRGSDLVQGKVVATEIKFSELLHKERHSDGKRTYWITVFKGIFFIADFNKNFNGRTFVLPDSGIDLFGIGKMLEKWFEGRGEPVTMENPAFEKLFKVFSDDQVEARYILSTSLMERLVEFRSKVKNNISVSFIHSKVFLAILLAKDLFEPNEFSSGVKSDYLKEYFYYLNLIVGIVDDLNLITRVWSKQ